MAIQNVQFQARVVILGASNVTRGMSTVFETCRHLLGGPLEIIAAIGHGRSYGTDSTVLIRTLPGILHCGIWDALSASREQNPHLPTYALITDIGNDIMYDAPPQQVIDWVEECINRLTLHDAQIAMTLTPIEGIQALKPWQYSIVKSILFPTRRISFEQAIERAGRLHDELIALGHRRKVREIQLSPEWYGFDPIHIQLRRWNAAWLKILSEAFNIDASNRSGPRASILSWLRARLKMPEHYWLAGRERRTGQPAGCLEDGTTISLY